VEGRGDSPAGDGAIGEDKKSPQKFGPEGDDPLYEIEEHSDLLSAMLDSAAADCRRRAVANRESIKTRFQGRKLQDELAAARRLAATELAATLAVIRRDHAPLRGSCRRRRRAGAAHL
jgi:hypothetical protein